MQLQAYHIKRLPEQKQSLFKTEWTSVGDTPIEQLTLVQLVSCPEDTVRGRSEGCGGGGGGRFAGSIQIR